MVLLPGNSALELLQDGNLEASLQLCVCVCVCVCVRVRVRVCICACVGVGVGVLWVYNLYNVRVHYYNDIIMMSSQNSSPKPTVVCEL